MNDAVGLIEVYGLACAFLAADAGCKAANVRLEDFDRNRPMDPTLPVPLLVTVKFRGSVADVEAAMDAAQFTAQNHSGMTTRHIIPAPTNCAAKMLKLSGFDNKR